MKETGKFQISRKCTIYEALSRLGQLPGNTMCLFVVDEAERVIGTLTDGDIRRFIVAGGQLNDAVEPAMKREFHYLSGDRQKGFCFRDLRAKGIALLPKLDSGGRIEALYNLSEQRSILPVDAVLMAGGRGERLRPLTEKTPKPLLPIGDKAIIDYNIDALIYHGVENISVTINYLKEQLEAHFAEPRRDIQIRCVQEETYLGTIGALRLIPEFHYDVVLVMNSDLFTNIDYENMYLEFEASGADAMIATFPFSINVPLGVLEFKADNTVCAIREKPIYDYHTNAGIYLFKRKFIDLIPPDTVFNATDLLERIIDSGGKVNHFSITGYWIDIGKPEEYRKACELAKHACD